ncbi:hypothetical protein [Methylopila sp. M107]|nr:hypothetical protein [Methylopila sp. M107]
MTFGPELPPEEQQRRLRIVTRVGVAMVAGIFAFVLFGALIAPLML